MKLLKELKYAESHEWVKVDGNKAYVGITDYAQDQLGEVVYVELPEVGTTVNAGDQCIVLESVKAASDVYSPVGGTVVEVHDHLPNDLETEDEKWFTRITVFGNDRRYKYNPDLCNLIRSVKNNFSDLETYAVEKDIYDMAKEKTIGYYTLPLTQKQFPQLSREERLKKHFEYLKLLEEK